MSIHRTLTEAKASFSDCVREAEKGNAVILTRHGKTIAALVPAEDVKQLERLRAASTGTGLAGLAGGWEGSDDLVKEIKKLGRRGRREIDSFD